MGDDNLSLIRELNRMKVLFQLRTIETILSGAPTAGSAPLPISHRQGRILNAGGEAFEDRFNQDSNSFGHGSAYT